MTEQMKRTRLENFRYEFFSVNAGTSVYKGSGGSLKKAAGTLQGKELHLGFMDVVFLGCVKSRDYYSIRNYCCFITLMTDYAPKMYISKVEKKTKII